MLKTKRVDGREMSDTPNVASHDLLNFSKGRRFATILADPPWQFTKQDRESGSGAQAPVACSTIASWPGCRRPSIAVASQRIRRTFSADCPGSCYTYGKGR
jgi:hypothetical protein